MPIPIQIQYQLFDPIPTEAELCQKQIDALSEQVGNVRRGLFSRHSELAKLYVQQVERADKQQQEINNMKKEIETLREMMMKRVK